MTWLNRLESKFGHLAIPGLLRYVAAFNALCFILIKIQPAYLDFLMLDPERVMQGQIWRLFTFVFIPAAGTFDWLWQVFLVFWLMFLGDGLEQAWGSFKLNVYYLLGIAGTAIAGMFFGAPFSSMFVDASLLFAFANFYPETMIRLMLVLPVKVKWLAWITAALMMYNFLVTPFWSFRVAVLVALGNYFLFFGREIIENARMQQEVRSRRARFERDMREGEEESMHRCKVCGRTERVAPDLEFRVAADGEEYCLDDLPKAGGR